MDVKQRISELEAYRRFIEDRISSPIPPKHKDRPETFKAYLKRELEMVVSKLERLKVND